MTEKDSKYGVIIQYDWRHWMVDHFDESLYGGWYFAKPIWLNDDWKYEVRRGGTNRCYVSNWAIEVCNLTEFDRMDVYRSELTELEKSLGHIKKYVDWHRDAELTQSKIDFINKKLLSNSLPPLTIQN